MEDNNSPQNFNQQGGFDQPSAAPAAPLNNVQNSWAPPAHSVSHGHDQPAWSPPQSRRGFFKSVAYLPEYVVMLIMLLTLVASVTALIGLGLDALINAEQPTTGDYSEQYFGNINTFQLVSALSALIVSLPVFAWLFVRTRRTETDSPKVRQHRWRKAFLAIFLVIEGLVLIWTIGDLIYDLLSRMIGSQAGLLSLISGGSADPWWQVSIATALNVGVLALVIFVMSRDYRSREAS